MSEGRRRWEEGVSEGAASPVEASDPCGVLDVGRASVERGEGVASVEGLFEEGEGSAPVGGEAGGVEGWPLAEEAEEEAGEEERDADDGEAGDGAFSARLASEGLVETGRLLEAERSEEGGRWGGWDGWEGGCLFIGISCGKLCHFRRGDLACLLAAMRQKTKNLFSLKS